MLKIVGTCFTALLFMVSAGAQTQQTIERGNWDELRGVTTVQVSSNNDRARSNIVEYLRKNLPQLTITDKPQEAQVWLIFQIKQRPFPKGSGSLDIGMSRTAPVVDDYEIVATGAVIKPVKAGHVRSLMDYRDSTGSILADQLSKEFVRKFVRRFNNANKD